MNWRDYIASTPDVLRRKPRIKGTRIPVSLILGYLAEGATPEQIIEEFPELTKEHIAALQFGRQPRFCLFEPGLRRSRTD